MREPRKIFLMVVAIWVVGIMVVSFSKGYTESKPILNNPPIHEFIENPTDEQIEDARHKLLRRKLEAINRTVNIVYYTPVSDWLGKHFLEAPADCPIAKQCKFSEYRRRFRPQVFQNNEEDPGNDEDNQVIEIDDYTDSPLSSADGVVFHIPQHSGDYPTGDKPSNQIWVALSMESEQIYTSMKDPEVMKNFDATMTYRLNSDIVAGYWSSKIENYMKPPLFPKKIDSPLASFFASNCVQERTDYVEEMMKHMSIDSYGSCLQNVPEEKVGRKGKLETIAKYKFYLAFESHSSIDYVTEKFYDGFIVGTVPVYKGAPNIEEFAPSPNSYIRADNFTSPKELSEYLTYLSNNDQEYQKYFEWKKTGPSEQFMKLLRRNRLDARCRLCIFLGEKLV